jgi:hypothetical protein
VRTAACSFRRLTGFCTAFTCSHCNVVPEQVVDGKAAIAVVRHKLGCPTLVAQTRTRWSAQLDVQVIVSARMSAMARTVPTLLSVRATL